MRRWRSRSVVWLTITMAALALSCGGGATGEGKPRGKPTVAEAQQFIEDAEARLLDLWIESGQASWVKANFITEDTEALEAKALEILIATKAISATPISQVRLYAGIPQATRIGVASERLPTQP